MEPCNYDVGGDEAALGAQHETLSYVRMGIDPTDVELLAFRVIDWKPTKFLGVEEEKLNIGASIVEEIRRRNPHATILANPVRTQGVAASTDRNIYEVYVAGFGLPDMENLRIVVPRPEFRTENCPELALHTREFAEGPQIDGWQIEKREDGSYREVPRYTGDILDAEVLRQDLITKLGSQRADDTIRLIRSEDVIVESEDGVQELYCYDNSNGWLN